MFLGYFRHFSRIFLLILHIFYHIIYINKYVVCGHTTVIGGLLWNLKN